MDQQGTTVTPEAEETQEAKNEAADNEAVDKEETTESKVVSIEKEKLENMQQQIVRLQKQEKKREAEQRAAEEKRLAEKGEWQKLAEERAEKLAALEQETATQKRNHRIFEAATRYKFHNPEDIAALLGNSTDLDDDTALEQAVINLKNERPYLVNNGTSRTGGAIDPPPTGLTAERLGSMSPEEIRELPEADVLAVYEAASNRR